MSTREQRADWRKEFEGRMMASAIWEYCPDEFGELLDDCDRLEQRRDELLAALHAANNALAFALECPMDPAARAQMTVDRGTVCAAIAKCRQ